MINTIVKQELQKSIDLFSQLLEDNHTITQIEEIVSVILNALRYGRKILLCGNGGSAADAQHLAAEFVGRFAFDRPALSAIALTVDTSALTAIANDYGYDFVFSRQVEALGSEGDILIGISTSGRSKNILKAFQVAKEKKLITIAFLGENKTDIGAISDLILSIPSPETPKIQEAHITIGHLICAAVEKKMFLNIN